MYPDVLLGLLFVCLAVLYVFLLACLPSDRVTRICWKMRGEKNEVNFSLYISNFVHDFTQTCRQ